MTIARDIISDIENNIYVTGYYGDSIYFESQTLQSLYVSKGSHDMFLIKLNSEGQIIWIHTVGGIDNETGYALEVDDQNNVFVVGEFNHTVDFDPGPDQHILFTPSAWGALFYMKMTSDKNLCWASDLETRSFWQGEESEIHVDKDNSILVVSNFRGDMDVDPGADQHVIVANELNDDDWFVTKLSSCQHLDLSISHTDNTLTVGETDGFYQWLDCNEDYDLIDGANQQSFTPSELGNYAVLVLSEGCLDTSECVDMTMIGIEPQIRPELIQVWPNPTSGTIHIDLDNIPLTNGELLIRNANGKLVGRTILNEMAQSTYLLPKTKGLYVIEIISDKIRYMARVVVD